MWQLWHQNNQSTFKALSNLDNIQWSLVQFIFYIIEMAKLVQSKWKYVRKPLKKSSLLIVCSYTTSKHFKVCVTVINDV